MFDKYIEQIYTASYTQALNNLVAVPFKYLERTLSQTSYSNILSILKPVLTVCIVLYIVYIIFSILHFLHSLIFKGRFRLKVLISVLISIFMLYTFYVAYRYLFIF